MLGYSLLAETKNNEDPFLRSFFTVRSPKTEAITILSFFGVTLLSTISKSPDKIPAGILSGDLLIVDRSVTPKNDNIVIASVFGDLTVKKLRKKGSSLFLVSANNEYPSIEIKEEMECFIWGVVTYVIHKAVTK